MNYVIIFVSNQDGRSRNLNAHLTLTNNPTFRPQQLIIQLSGLNMPFHSTFSFEDHVSHIYQQDDLPNIAWRRRTFSQKKCGLSPFLKNLTIKSTNSPCY